MTVFLLICYLNSNIDDKIYFKNVNDCIFYAERLNKQMISVPEKVESYQCMCKLVSKVNIDKVKVY